MRAISLYHNYTAGVDVQSLYRWFGIELQTVEGVPRTIGVGCIPSLAVHELAGKVATARQIVAAILIRLHADALAIADGRCAS